MAGQGCILVKTGLWVQSAPCGELTKLVQSLGVNLLHSQSKQTPTAQLSSHFPLKTIYVCMQRHA